MKYKEALDDYYKKVEERNALIVSETEMAWNDIEKNANSANKKSRDNAQKINEAPCSICGKSKFVMKYREVVGKIEGSVSGSFSLFGGSISGYINGDINTKPILSCRECENERQITIPGYTYSRDLLENQYPCFWEYVGDSKGTGWINKRGLEVARLLQANHLIFIKDYHILKGISDGRAAAVGLFNKYPALVKPKWYQFIF